MSAEAHKSILHKMVEAMNAHNLDALAACYTDDFTVNGQPFSMADMKLVRTMFREAFPDVEYSVENIIAGGDQLAVRMIIAGTHQGTFRDIAPTGRRITHRGMGTYRFRDGRMAEEWVVFDQLSLLQQLGAVPVPTA